MIWHFKIIFDLALQNYFCMPFLQFGHWQPAILSPDNRDHPIMEEYPRVSFTDFDHVSTEHIKKLSLSDPVPTQSKAV